MSSLIRYSATGTSITVRFINLPYIGSSYVAAYLGIENDVGIVDEWYVEPPTGSSNYIEHTFAGLSTNTRYYIYGTLWYDDGESLNEYNYGSITVWTRPTNWAWNPIIVTGGDMVTATQWIDFLDRINDFRYYKGLGDGTFTYPNSGDDFTATIFNQARTAINAMSPSITVPSAQVQGSIIYASLLNGLMNSINSLS